MAARRRKGFPRGHKELVREGYRFLHAGNCRERECQAAVLWYRTPKGKRLPVDAARKIPHWWICPALERERLQKQAARDKSAQIELFPW